MNGHVITSTILLCYFYISYTFIICISLLLVLIFPLYEIVNLYKMFRKHCSRKLCRV